jgi:tetratricopeptide (TPR) repeat protein
MIRNFRNSGRLIGILLLLIIFPACAQMKNGPSPQAPVQEASPITSAQEPVQIKQHLLAGDHQKTIDAYKAEHAKRPQDKTLVKDFVKSLEEIKVAADQEFERNNFASAGKTYNVLLKNYQDFRTFVHMLSFDRPKLNTKLTSCKSSLSKKGFHEYRQGNLSEAIALWQGYLAIDPNNADIKKALNTAKLQQKNLQQKE